MEFVRIEAGQMQAAVFQPSCPAPSDPALNPKDGVIDPHILWTRSDFDRCHQLADRDRSSGFRVTIPKDFYIGKFEVTQGEWTKVMGSNPSVFQSPRVGDAPRHPIDSVTWNDAQAFVARLNRLEQTDVYRLPAEFEWEYAGRAGGPGQIAWDEIRAQAVQGLRAASGTAPKPTTRPVGSRAPNRWGLYDMLGNLWEWVQDYYNEKTFPDPVPPRSGTQHVLKGGGFVSDVKNTIYATHAAGPADGWDVGFRIVRDVK